MFPCAAARPVPAQNVGHYVPGYTGPRDGLSHPKYGWLCRNINRALIAGQYRLEVEGGENLPTEGAHVYCPTHPSYFDPPLIAHITAPRDVRYVANIYVFDGIRGRLMTWGGAFPVNREKADFRTMRHCKSIVQQGKGLCIFPAGVIEDEHWEGKIGSLKKGAAHFAVTGGAESVVPIAIDYVPNARQRPRETAMGLVAAASVLAAGVGTALVGGPSARILASTLTATLAGTYIGGKIMRDRTPITDRCDVFPKYFATLNGAACGAVAGGLLGGLGAAFLGAHSPVVTGIAAAAGAFGTWGLARAWRDRDIARVVIAKPLPVAPYRESYPNRKEAVRALTIDLHRALGTTKSYLSGVPYDDTAEKFRGNIVENMKPQTPPQ